MEKSLRRSGSLVGGSLSPGRATLAGERCRAEKRVLFQSLLAKSGVPWSPLLPETLRSNILETKPIKHTQAGPLGSMQDTESSTGDTGTVPVVLCKGSQTGVLSRAGQDYGVCVHMHAHIYTHFPKSSSHIFVVACGPYHSVDDYCMVAAGIPRADKLSEEL